jgi:MOSC domain-containing protein YiiM
MPTVISVNVGMPRELDHNGRAATSAIWKTPVEGPVRARGVNLDGDGQADRDAHGGYDRAIYAYASEDTAWWESELDRSIDGGGFGENLTTQGIDHTSAVIGERWRAGGTILEVSEPRVPCWKLARRMDEKRFIQRFNSAGRPGTYLRIIEEGDIAAGDPIEVVSVPDHGFTIGDVWRIYQSDRQDAGLLLNVDALSDAWKAWATKQNSPAS